MIKKIAWDTFKNTGDINTFLELKQLESLEKQINDLKDIQTKNNINLENNFKGNNQRVD